MKQPELLRVATMRRHDEDYVIYKNRKVLICPKPSGPGEDVAVMHDGLDGIITVESQSDHTNRPWYMYKHHIIENGNPYRGYSSPIMVGFDISEENLMRRFYPFYFRKDGDSHMRCPASSLDEAWQYSEQFGEYQETATERPKPNPDAKQPTYHFGDDADGTPNS